MVVKMWIPVFLLFFFTTTISVHSKTITTNYNEIGFAANRLNARLTGFLTLTSAEQTEYDQLKYIAYIKEIAGDTQIGNGIIINDFWTLTVTSVVSSYTPAQISIVIYANPLQIQGITRRVKGIVNNDVACADKPNEACVSLIRVCPSISPDYFATIAPSLSGYRDTTVHMKLYRHSKNGNGEIVMLRGEKNIGEICECMDISGWNKNSHICLAEDAVVHAETTDMKTIVVTNNDRTQVIGFLIVEQTTGFGEIVLHVEAVRQFITDNALTAPYNY